MNFFSKVCETFHFYGFLYFISKFRKFCVISRFTNTICENIFPRYISRKVYGRFCEKLSLAKKYLKLSDSRKSSIVRINFLDRIGGEISDHYLGGVRSYSKNFLADRDREHFFKERINWRLNHLDSGRHFSVPMINSCENILNTRIHNLLP